MFSAAFLVVRTFFGGIFSKIFSNWRIFVAIVLVCVIGYAGWKYKSLNSDLADAQKQIQVEQKNNETLRGNVSTLQAANDQNQIIISQLTADKQMAIESVGKLTTEIAKTNQALNVVQKKIDTIKTPPVKLTPYISSAIEGIQASRAAKGETK